MKPITTVIVPIYKTEKHLDDCLNSIRKQSLKEIEIICIDDCSPDGSYLIVEKHMSEDSRVSLIRHDVNKGLGGARNTGIKAARAEFIASVDSDDTIKKEMLEVLWGATNNGEKDIVCCGYDELNEKGNILHSRQFPAKTYQNNDHGFDIFNTLNPSFCNKLWRRSLFVDNHIQFPEKLLFEDTATTPRVLMKANSVKTIETSLYNYYQREQSITSTFTREHISDLFNAYEIVFKALGENDLLNHYNDEFVEYIESGVRFHSQGVASSNMQQAKIDQYLGLLEDHKTSFLEEKLSVIANKTNKLSAFQKAGSKGFEYLFGSFISPTHLKKLKHHPEYFFKDSKNKFTRFIGVILRII